ncbi:hypothetical protein BH10PAT1_BH10PAT1_0150 [soil metagenome]
MNLNKTNHKLLLALSLFLILVVIVFISSRYVQPTNKQNAVPATLPVQTQPIEATIYVTKSSNTNSLEVKLSPKSQKTISGMSIRLTYNSDANLPEPLSFTPDETLIAAGWSYPIKKISVDSTSKLVTIDISAININPTGYDLSAPITLGTIDFGKTDQISLLTLDLDTTVTKILTKTGDELNYDFVNK